ncbi:hypothetical protein BDV06DRAFT_221896 [Aspergillus oleicola]
MGTGTDGKTTRLRASCDACNESKVRCSQVKPSCARCDKQGITCIYGLSRRTHKDAPRVGTQTMATTITTASTSISASLTHSLGPTGDDERLSSSSPRPLLSSPYPALDESTRATSVISEGIFTSDHLGSLSDTLLLSLPRSSLCSGEQQSQIPLLALDEDLLDSYDFHNQYPLSLPMTDIQLNQHTQEANAPHQIELTNSPIAAADDAANRSSCSCESHLMTQLVAILQAFKDHGPASFELLLSELQKAVKVVDSCMQCTCTLQDHLVIFSSHLALKTHGYIYPHAHLGNGLVIISTLVVHIIRGFEKALPRAGLLRDSTDAHVNGTPPQASEGQKQHHGQHQGHGHAPMLSWGLLHIEPDDEDKLKRHLWLLHFRRFRCMFAHLNESIGQLKGTESRKKLAQIAAYQFIYKWLEHEVDNVTSQYQLQEGVEEGTLLRN